MSGTNDENETIRILQRVKGKAYRDLKTVTQGVSPDDEDIDKFEEKLATQIVGLIDVLEQEVTMRYYDRVGWHRRERLEGLLEAEKERMQKIHEEFHLEEQWNPDFLDWMEKRLREGGCES